MKQPSHDDGTLSDEDLANFRVEDIEALAGPIEAISDDEINAEGHEGDFDVDTHLTPHEQGEHTENALKVLEADNG